MSKKFQFRLLYNGTDISRDIAAYAGNITFVDNAESEADTLEISLLDTDGRWIDEWYPEKGATLTFSCWYEGEEGAGIPPTEYELDAPQFKMSAGGSGGTKINLRAKTVPDSLPLNTKGSEAFEGQTLEQIARKVAGDLGLEFVGEIKPIQLKRITREDETPLEFLKRLAEKYGYWFKIESKSRLVFYAKESLDNQEPAFILDAKECESISWESNRTEKYSGARLSYTDPETSETIEVEVEAEEEGIETENVLTINEPVDNEFEARIVAAQKLRRANSDGIKLNGDRIGDPRHLAGVAYTQSGIGRDSGKFLIKTVRHRLSFQSGWTTSWQAEAKRFKGDEATES